MLTIAPRAQTGSAAFQDDPMSDHLGSTDPVQERATKLFEYLAALVELRTKMVRDCDSYERAFWLDDLPREPECHTPAWSGENGDDAWIRIDKPSKPVFPSPPEECGHWVDRATLADLTNEPVLLQEIVAAEGSDLQANSDEEDLEVPRLRLEDFPGVTEAWEAYIDEEWKPWRDRHDRWERVQKAYRQLFGIYQLQRRRGEQFELVLGAGTLLWKSESGHRVRRPVMTAHVTISMESVSGRITVSPTAEGAGFTLEQDMLEVEERPPVTDQREFERQVSTMRSFWDQHEVLELLKSWVNTLPVPEAEFSDSLSCPERATKTPRMAYSPVLMLRRRSGQTLHSAIKKVVDQLQDATTIPLGIREVCGEFSHRNNDDGTPTSKSRFQIPEELLFPLPTNSEQEQIVQRLNGHPGILVQGPPGTGKSHTIANLICHFLAHGKRVLVTSQTPRALKVLHDKLPSRLQALCVSLLGNDQGSLRSLERSVHGILSKVNAWNRQDSEHEIQRITQERRACLSELSHLRRVQRELREAEISEHFIADSPYHGSAQRIAQQIESDDGRFNWLSDDVSEDTKCPMSSEELTELAGLLEELHPDDFELPNYEIPTAESLPSVAEFQRASTSLVEAQSAASPLGKRLTTPRVLGLSQVSEDALRCLVGLAKECHDIQNALSGCEESWVRSSVLAILRGHHHSWVTLYNYTSESLDYLGKFPVDTPLTIRTPPEIDESQLLSDAGDLLQHLKSGSRLGFWIFRAPVVKRCQYLWQSYRFNGGLCDSVSALQSLVDHLELRDALRRLWNEWSGHCNPPSGSFRQQLERLAECQRLLGLALRMQELAELASSTLADANCPTPSLQDETWTSELLEDIKASRVIQSLAAAQSDVDEVLVHALNLRELSPRHEVVGSLLDAVERLDVDEYLSALASVEQVRQTRGMAMRCLELDGRLRTVAPRLATELKDEDRREELMAHLAIFEEAWGWKRAVDWLRRFVAESDGDLDCRIATAEEHLSQLTEELVALRAWQSCNAHLSQDFQKQGALQAWQQIMRKIGKGQSKYVETHRRDARKYMEQCRDAIPAWIMPLHRVAETVEMKPGAFDIVIVDEASQMGPEGLILHYIGRQCIIVGDDKQISPEAVGVNLNAVRSLMEQHLSDFPYAETLAPTSSLFDQATIRYGNRVTLREHFRCMPEIIRFSNDLCYSDTPLIPLRQYPPKRLDPILVRHVVDGYREGKSSNVINRPEAAAVTKTVIDCLGDLRYAGKTMGVICLQGHAQAQLIEHMLLDAVGPKPFEERQLICGDAYSFQGDERDVIFMSMVAASEGQGRFAALVRETFQKRFNVAASRARDQVWLFHSVQRDELNPQCMRRRLLDSYYNPATEELSTDLSDCETEFERQVAMEFVKRRYRVIPQYPYAGKRIDLLVEGTKSRLAIECDGDEWHGPDCYEADMQRQRILERAGWKFVRVRGSCFHANRQAEVARMLDEIEAQGIEPVTDRDPVETDCSYIGDIKGRDCLESLGSVELGESSDSNGMAISEPNQGCFANEFSTDESAVGLDDDEVAEERSEEMAVDIEAPKPAGTSSKSAERGHVLPFDQSDPPSTEKEATALEQPDDSFENQQAINMDSSMGNESTETSGENLPVGVGGTVRPRAIKNTPAASDGEVRVYTQPSQYAEYDGTKCHDPRTGNKHAIAKGLLRIINVEGPMLARRAYDIYRHSCGIGRIDRELKQKLNKAMQFAIDQGLIVKEDELNVGGLLHCTMRPNGTPSIRFRERGPRSIDEIPPSELLVVASLTELTNRFPRASDEHLRAILNFYGLSRLTNNARETIDKCLTLRLQSVDDYFLRELTG